ncbi:MAG: hypothetical protein JWM93_2030 [Frankiales bacterium]|nr:hypothetical protein [Frankiales bacterium]
MPQISLDDIRKAAAAKYQEFVIPLGEGQEPVVLLPYLRMSKESRKAWDNRTDPGDVADGEVADPDADTLLDYHRMIVRIVARSDSDAERLIEAVGDDAATFQELLQEYANGTSVGEASPSQS